MPESCSNIKSALAVLSKHSCKGSSCNSKEDGVGKTMIEKYINIVSTFNDTANSFDDKCKILPTGLKKGTCAALKGHKSQLELMHTVVDPTFGKMMESAWNTCNPKQPLKTRSKPAKIEKQCSHVHRAAKNVIADYDTMKKVCEEQYGDESMSMCTETRIRKLQWENKNYVSSMYGSDAIKGTTFDKKCGFRNKFNLPNMMNIVTHPTMFKKLDRMGRMSHNPEDHENIPAQMVALSAWDLCNATKSDSNLRLGKAIHTLGNEAIKGKLESMSKRCKGIKKIKKVIQPMEQDMPFSTKDSEFHYQESKPMKKENQKCAAPQKGKWNPAPFYLHAKPL